VVGGDLEAAHQALAGSGITMRELVYAHFIDAGSPRLMNLAAVVEAEDDDRAVADVRSKLPASDGYELEANLLPHASA
jgi:hypothetical protein